MLPPKSGTYAHANLDLMRGIAALFVLIQHARMLLILTTAEVPGIQPWQKVFYFITSLGTPAVMLFFALSGFLVGASVIQDFRQGTWSWRKYMSARLARIYTVLIPAIIIGTLLDVAGNYYLGKAPVYAMESYNAMYTHQIISQVNVETFIGNLLQLQGITVPTLGSNGPLWSLAYEAWYYLLFPLLFGAIYSLKKPVQLILSLALAVAIFALINVKISLLFLVWLMGAAIVFLPKFNAKPWHALLTFGSLVGAMVIGSAHLMPLQYEVFMPYAIGGLTALLIYVICSLPTSKVSKLYEQVALFLPRISFTLYLTHVPFVVLLTALILPQGPRMLPEATGIGWVASMSGMALIYATVLWFLFERNTGAVRKWLFTQLGRLMPGPVPTAKTVPPSPKA